VNGKRMLDAVPYVLVYIIQRDAHMELACFNPPR
jgi:hypothetical protein